MQIDREQIVTLLQGEGHLDQAQQALSSLPAVIDTTEHAQLLEQIGLDPTQLMESFGVADHLEAVNGGIDQHQDAISNITEGGLGGIVEKIKDFIGSKL